ncbi:MAG: SRPBCC domain-containing protein [Bacteroidales bacterium]|nr:SRPBCC domain-containing protein [Bacteroidales bacterium]MBN2697813.1 SRPBCC domain-containing protein [Bacteroidales bacterium]
MKDLRRFYRIKADAGEVYSALTNPFSIELWSGNPAKMIPEAGTEFSMFDGEIEGINLEFVKDSKIVQEWYFGEREEKSIVTILLSNDRLYTKIELTQTNIPDEAFEEMLTGWDQYYFGALKDFFEK